MTATLAIATIRARGADDPAAFQHAFHRGVRSTADEAELEIASYVRAGDCSAAAGLIEGLAALRVEAGWPLHSSAPHWRRHPGFGGAK